MFDLKIINARIVTASDTFEAELGILAGRIEAVSRGTLGDAKETIDAMGRYVLPGGIDTHTHLDMPFGGTVSADDFYTGTVAAACGGTTTIIDFAMQGKGESLSSAVERWKAKAQDKAVVDYGFHVAITECTDAVIEELGTLAGLGVTSVKLFMAYKGALMVSDEILYRVMQRASGTGVLTMVHAENGDVIDHLSRRLQGEGKLEPKYHAASRPSILEGEATGRALALAYAASKAPLFVVHLTCREALDELTKAQRRGQPAFAETCPQYLLLTSERYDEADFGGAKYVMSPPLREKADCEALWSALFSGAIHTVGSDHCPFNFRGQKTLGKDNFALIPNGAPGIETRLPLMFSEGPRRGRISLNRFVEVVSTAPAKLFGLYPRKGAIAPGSDADIVILEPKSTQTLSAKTLHQNVDYCPYEGMEIAGRVRTVLSRGTPIVKHGRFIGKRGTGQFVERRPFDISIA
ncbi:MAG: dihydropyrimidinase [Planctomycetota bacterium]|nr:dihydropyrimidinase [Planctomycetota bacterium]